MNPIVINGTVLCDNITGIPRYVYETVVRLDKLIELNTEAGFVTCETGMIFATLEDLVNEKGYSVMHLPSCMTCS